CEERGSSDQRLTHGAPFMTATGNGRRLPSYRPSPSPFVVSHTWRRVSVRACVPAHSRPTLARAVSLQSTAAAEQVLHRSRRLVKRRGSCCDFAATARVAFRHSAHAAT